MGQGESVIEGRYTCYRCNRSWALDDPGFVYWNRFPSFLPLSHPHPEWAGMPKDGRDGRPRSSLGWFAHCANSRSCDQTKRNIAAGTHPDQTALA